MSETYRGTCPLGDVDIGWLSIRNEGDVHVNSDGAKFVTECGTWQPLYGTYAVAKPPPPITFATVAATCKLVARISDSAFELPMDDPEWPYTSRPQAEAPALKHDPSLFNDPFFGGKPAHVYTGPVAQPVAEPWHEPSTCRGILRALEEARAKHPTAVHELGGPMERVRAALIDFDKALGSVKQDGWDQWVGLQFIISSLVEECLNAMNAGMAFSKVSVPCAKATDAVAEVLSALKKVGAK